MFQLGSYKESGFGTESFDFLPESDAQAQERRYPTSFPFVNEDEAGVELYGEGEVHH